MLDKLYTSVPHISSTYCCVLCSFYCSEPFCMVTRKAAATAAITPHLNRSCLPLHANKIVENCICTLRNLSFRLELEIPPSRLTGEQELDGLLGSETPSKEVDSSCWGRKRKKKKKSLQEEMVSVNAQRRVLCGVCMFSLGTLVSFHTAKTYSLG